MQKQESSSISITPCFGGHILKGVHKAAKNGLSVISIKQTHRNCTFSFDPNTSLPLISCAQGFKARNSFRSLQKPDLSNVRGLECSTAESITELLNAHNEKNAGKPSYKKKILRLLDSLTTKKSRSPTHNCIILGEKQSWPTNHCVLSSICREKEIKRNVTVGSQDLTRETDLSVGKQIISSRQPTDESNTFSCGILTLKEKGGLLESDNNLSNLNQSNDPCIGGNCKIEQKSGTYVSTSPCMHTALICTKEVKTETELDTKQINKTSCFYTDLTNNTAKVPTPTESEVTTNEEEILNNIGFDNGVVCESQFAIESCSTDTPTEIFQPISEEKLKDSQEKVAYESEVKMNKSELIKATQSDMQGTDESITSDHYCAEVLSIKIAETTSNEVRNASKEFDENTLNIAKYSSNVFTEALEYVPKQILKGIPKEVEYNYESPITEVCKKISEENMQTLQASKETMANSADKTEYILENTSANIKMPSRELLKNAQETESAYMSKSNSNKHSPLNLFTMCEAASNEIFRDTQEIELSTSKNSANTDGTTSITMEVLKTIANNIARDLQELEEYSPGSTEFEEHLSTQEIKPIYNEMVKELQEQENYTRSHISSLLVIEEQFEKLLTQERCSIEDTEFVGGMKNLANVLGKTVSHEDYIENNDINNKENVRSSSKQIEEDTIVYDSEYEESKSVSQKDCLLNVSHSSSSASPVTGYCYWDSEAVAGSAEVEELTNQSFLLCDTQEKTETALISPVFIESVWKKWFDKPNLSTDSNESYEFYNIPERKPEYCYWTSMYDQNILEEAQNIVEAIDFFFNDCVMGEQSTTYGYVPCSITEIINDNEYEEKQFISAENSILSSTSIKRSLSKVHSGNNYNVSQTDMKSNFELNFQSDIKNVAFKEPDLNELPKHNSSTTNTFAKNHKDFQRSEAFLDFTIINATALENPFMCEIKSSFDEINEYTMNPVATNNKSTDKNEQIHQNQPEHNSGGNEKYNILNCIEKVSSISLRKVNHDPSNTEENKSDLQDEQSTVLLKVGYNPKQKDMDSPSATCLHIVPTSTNEQFTYTKPL